MKAKRCGTLADGGRTRPAAPPEPPARSRDLMAKADEGKTDQIVAALLHDAIEDQKIPRENLTEHPLSDSGRFYRKRSTRCARFDLT